MWKSYRLLKNYFLLTRNNRRNELVLEEFRERQRVHMGFKATKKKAAKKQIKKTKKCFLEEYKRILSTPIGERTKKDIKSLQDIIYHWNDVSLKDKNSKKIKKLKNFSRRSKYATFKRGE